MKNFINITRGQAFKFQYERLVSDIYK